MISSARIIEVLKELNYVADIRNPPDAARLVQFKIGWRKAVAGAEYTAATLSSLTWNNCGFRVGRELGPANDEEIEAVYSTLSHFYHSTSTNEHVADSLAGSVTELNDDGYFDPESIEDQRHRITREVVQRRGQPAFRAALVYAYSGRCAITGCDAPAALEAAHIAPYLGEPSNHVTNGILLRADIHTLFDLHQIAIEPESMTVALSPQLRDTTYAELDGEPLNLPAGQTLAPSQTALEQRWAERGWQS